MQALIWFAMIVVLIDVRDFDPSAVAAAAAVQEGTPLPLVVITGNDSRVNMPRLMRIMTSDSWRAVWLEHLGLVRDTIYRPAVEVDFTRCEVIAVFRGNAANSCGLAVKSVMEGTEMVRVRFDDIAFQTEGGFQQSTPFAFIVLSKSKQAVTVEEDVQSLLGKPPIWQEIGRLQP